MSAGSPSSPCRAGWVTPREGLVAELLEAGNADDVPEIVEAEHALELVDLLLLDPQGGDEPLAQPGIEPARELEADHLAEAATADLLLDGAAHVIRLIGDVVVGVAGDAEERVADDLHAREEGAEVAGDDLLHGDEADPVRQRDEAPQELLRDLDAGEDVAVLLGVAKDDEQAQREVRDVGEGPAHAEHQRRQRRKHLAAEERIELAPIVGRGLLVGDDPDPVLGHRRTELPLEAVLEPDALADHLLADRGDLLGGAHPVGATPLDPRIDLLVQAGNADHEELVQVRLPDRTELEPLEQR